MARLDPSISVEDFLRRGRTEKFLPDAPRMEAKQKAVMVVCECGGPYRSDDLLRNQSSRGRVTGIVTPEGGHLPIAESFYEADRAIRDFWIKCIDETVDRMDKQRLVMMLATISTFSSDVGCENIVLVGHWPCLIANKRGLTLPDSIQRLVHATRYTQAEFPRCDVSAECHMFFNPDRMRTYAVDIEHPIFNRRLTLRA